MDTSTWVLIGVFALILIIALALMATYNKLVRLRNDVEEGFSTMDVYMKKRYDLIPNLVETVKGYAKHEKETLENVINARNMAMQSGSVEEQMKNENMLSGTLKSLFALSENYPDLKANTNFVSLQNDLNKVETDIANSRKYYNAVVKTYNTKTQIFPSSIVAKMFNFKRKPMFEVADAAERENVRVQF